jgi:secreted trypsin-like serine protease
MLCAGVLTTSPNTVCNGNDGGGLFCDFAGNWELVGVLSFGITCGVANMPAVFIETRQYEPWITAQFLRTDIPPPGSVSIPM